MRTRGPGNIRRCCARGRSPAIRRCAHGLKRRRRRILTHAVHLKTLRTDVMEMRARMRRELSKAGPGQFDLKQDAGGIADIEFLVQYWVLRGKRTRNPSPPDRVSGQHSPARGARTQRLSCPLRSDRTMACRYLYRLGYRGVLHRLSLEGGGARVVAAGEVRDAAGARAGHLALDICRELRAPHLHGGLSLQNSAP